MDDLVDNVRDGLRGGVALQYDEKVGRGCTLCDYCGANFEHKLGVAVTMRFVVLSPALAMDL